MALLGGTRDEAQTTAYMACNLQHWADHGHGLWILRDPQDDRVAGRAVFRHLDVEGTEEEWGVTRCFIRALKGRLGDFARP